MQRQERGKSSSEIASDRGDRGDTGPPEDVAGMWEFHLRVFTTTTDIVTTTIPINQTTGGNFSGSGSGVNHDRTPMKISIDGIYNASTNYIRGTITATWENKNITRIDRLSTRLTSNDTGEFSTTFESGVKGPHDGEIGLDKQ